MGEGEPSRGRGEKILVVDDTTANLRLLTNLLTEHGYQAFPASDGGLALEFVQSTPPDLILLDVRMQGMNGFEVCRQLTADERTRNIPIIFISILENQGDKVTGLRLGAVDYITKPFQPEEVLARVRIHLRLRELTEHLERTVDERTRELLQTTQRLEVELAERKRVEMELRASEEQLRLTLERYRMVFENSPVSIWEEDFSAVRTLFDGLREAGVTDLDTYFKQHPCEVRRFVGATRIVDVNRAALALHGAGAKEELLANFAATFTDESFKTFQQELLHLWNGETAITSDSVLKTLSGERRDVAISFRICPGYERSFSKVLVSIADISERKRAEWVQNRLNRELRAIGRCNQTLLRATDEQFLIGEVCRIVCEEAGYRMAWVGYAEQDAFKSVRPVAWAGTEDGYLATANISWSEEVETGRGPTGTAIRSGKYGYFQDFATDPRALPWRDKALQCGYRSSMAVPLQDEHGHTFGAITIYSGELNAFTPEEIRLLEGLAADLAFGIVTLRTRIERQRAEQERSRLSEHLQQVQKLEVVGQLAGGIAHDFNNLLGVVNGYSGILLDNPEIGGAARTQIQEILNAGTRGAALTRQLLAFSRKQVLQRKVLNLNLVITNMQGMLGRLIGEHIEIRLATDARLHPVLADPGQMEQVILNLCINARDAMLDGGTITIETVNVELGHEQTEQHVPLEPGRYVRLTVTDTGTGMTAETLSHVFEPFFTTKGPDRGTGLGLATVYGIVTQSGGQVLAGSTPGKGSTFSVYLPAAVGQAESAEGDAVPPGSTRGTETILLVEDVAALRALFRDVLEQSGYRVLEAADGEQALQIAQEAGTGIAMLLTDVVLPKIKGTLLAESLRKRTPGMKVLFVSGFSDHETVSTAAMGPGTAFLQKPFSLTELSRKVRELLDWA